GEKPFERMLIRPREFWDERGIGLRLGTNVTKVDAAAKTLAVTGGESIAYGTLIWAAGGDPRRLSCPGSHLGGIHAVRDKADTDRLLAELKADARQAVIVGGGYIGLEVAAALRKRGCEVTVIEKEDRLLFRVAGVDLARFYEAEHRAHGVDIRLGTEVEEIEGDGDRV